MRKARPAWGGTPACSRQHKKRGTVGVLHPINGGTMSTLYPKNGEQGPRRPHGSLERCSFWVGNHIPPSPPPRRGYPSLPSTQEEREERARELLFEGGGTSLQSCSFLSPGEGMTVGMVVPTPQRKSENPMGLILHLCFSFRKHPEFTLWSSMEPKT